MKTAPLLVLVVLLSAGTVVLTDVLLDGGDTSSPDALRLETNVAELKAAVGELRGSQAELEATLARLQLALTERPAPEPVALGELEAAVERVLAARALSGAADLAATGDELADAADEDQLDGLTLEAALAEFADFDSMSQMDREMLWERIREAGLMDDVIAHFEQLAEADPYNAELRTAVGVAYLQKIQELGNGPLAGVFAAKADAAFDQALELDGQNWDARFTKAVALSFWPPVFGKQNQAIQQFETLISQQEAGPSDPKHAQTYLLLGNLYQQVGQPEKARDAWVAGYDLFPEDASLKEQIVASGN